jgi:hypothetical protein
MTYYICSHCKKSYISKPAYNNHNLKCELRSICNKIQTNDEEEPELDVKFNGSINDVYKLLINLNNKFDKLETDYNELKKYANITKNKIDVIEYLNINFNYGDFDFVKFLNSIQITDTELQIIFQNDYINGISQIITDHIEKHQHYINIPIKAFNIKEGVLYICLLNPNATEHEWVIMDDHHIKSIMKYFNKKLSMLFLNWQEVNKKILPSDVFTYVYVKNMKRVFAINYEKKNMNALLKNKLYKHLKISIRNFLSHDFV